MRHTACVRPPVHLTPITRHRRLARRWFDRFEGAGLDGLIAKRGDQPGFRLRHTIHGARFRHTAQFVRWRPDRDPASCDYDQLAEPVPFDVAEVLAGRVT